MSDLPNGWAHAKLPDLIACDGVFIDGDWIESKDQDPNGDVRLIQLADVGDGAYINKSNRFLTRTKAIELGCTFLEPGDILVARMPDPLGRACIFPGDKKRAITVVDVCVVRGNPKHFENTWLMYFINTPVFRESIHGMQSGSTRKRISRGNLSTLKLPVPPRAEQTRIVEKLEELLSDLDAGVAELKAAQKKLAQYRQSLLKAAVEGALTAEWRNSQAAASVESGAKLLARILHERRARWEARQLAKFKEQGKTPSKDWQAKYPEPVAPDTTDLPELPQGWLWASVDQLFQFVRNGISKTPNTEGKGLPILRINAVRPMAVRMAEIKHIKVEPDEARDYVVEVGDLLATRYNGSVDLLGVFGMVRKADEETLHPDKLIRMKPVLAGSLGAWVEIAANTGFSRSFIVRRVKTTAGQTGISGEDLKKMPVPVPPINEQTVAVLKVDELLRIHAEQVEVINHSLKQAAAQRKNILQTAFSGRLVPQDPADEPASVLLERIRTERAARPSPITPRRRAKKTK